MEAGWLGGWKRVNCGDLPQRVFVVLELGLPLFEHHSSTWTFYTTGM